MNHTRVTNADSAVTAFAGADTTTTLRSVAQKLQLFEGIDRALRLLRKRRELNQGHLFDATKVHRTSISAYETGAKLPDIVTLDRLLVAMDADLQDLQGALDEVNGRPPRQRRSSAAVDQAALARLRLTYPHARPELLTERAVLEQQLREMLERVDDIQLQLDVDERRRGAGKPTPPGHIQERVREALAVALRMLHPEWPPERADEEADRRVKAEVASREPE